MRADPQVVRRLQQRAGDLLATEQKARRADGRAELIGESERQAGRSCIQTAISEYRSWLAENAHTPLSADDDEAIARAVEARAFGAGNLQHLIDDQTIENIDINGCDTVWVQYADGTRTQVDPVAESDEELIEQVQVLAAHAGLSSRPFDQANRELDLRLPDGSRLSAVQGNTPHPAVSIRRHRHLKSTLGDLVGTGTMSEDVADFLRFAVRARLNIIIAGAVNAGKTTLLRALAAEMDPMERLVTVERSLELGLDEDPATHPNLVVMEESGANAEGHGGVSMAQLVRRTLRMNPDRVIVGEVLGDEIVTMLNAMSQGNDGSLSTIHTNSARDTFTRIKIYAKQAREALDFDTTALLMASSLNLVVHLKRDGVRRSVREILEVTGYNGHDATSATVFADDGTGTAVRCVDVALSQQAEEAMTHVGWQPPETWW